MEPNIPPIREKVFPRKLVSISYAGKDGLDRPRRKAIADSKPVTTAELASRTGTTERYTREWLINQSAGGYISYDPNTTKCTLLLEQAMALANEK